MTNELSIGTVLSGKYVIEQVVGIGGFGITYRAKHAQLGYVVAIKEFFITGKCTRDTDAHTVIFQDLEPERFAKYKKRFLDEAKTLAALNHPHVVHVRDIFSENNTAYIVMDFVEGETLQHRVDRQGALSYNDAVNFIAQLTEAVAYIHANHILHRDIKPDNIILTPDNKAVLIDFGSARGFVNDQVQNHTAMLTPGYAPIEQYTTTSRKGNYTDVYSMGGVFYFAVTAKKPLDAAERMLNDTLQPPSAINPQFPKSASQVIMKAMNLKPAERYQDVDSFREALLSTLPSDGNVNQAPPTSGESTPDGSTTATTTGVDNPFYVGTYSTGSAPASTVKKKEPKPVGPKKKANLLWLWILLPIMALLTFLVVYLLFGRPATPDCTYYCFGADSQYETLYVDMGSSKFYVEESPDWCSISEILDEFSVSAEPNYSSDSRDGEIVVSSYGWFTTRYSTINISQSGNYATYLELSDYSCSPSRFGEEYTITVSTDAPLFQVTSDDDCSWCSFTQDDNSFTVTVDQNYSSYSRSTTLTVSAGDCSRTFTITQKGTQATYLYTSGVLSRYGYQSGDYYINVHCDGEWSVNVKLLSDFGYVTKISDSQLKLHLYYNGGSAHSDWFTLKSGSRSHRVTIYQN